MRFDAGWYIQLELGGPHRLGLAFLRDEPWGQRHVIVKDPGGNFVDLIAAIGPDPEFVKRWFS